MIYIEAPNEFERIKKMVDNKLTENTYSLFLAGGITNCPDWQKEIVELLEPTYLTVLNPRRENFPIHNPDAALEQITWEHYALRFAQEISFWFPKETLCPIVLYELGAWSMTKKKIYVGVHPEYERKQDVEIQISLVRPDVEIFYSLEELASNIQKYWN